MLHTIDQYLQTWLIMIINVPWGRCQDSNYNKDCLRYLHQEMTTIAVNYWRWSLTNIIKLGHPRSWGRFQRVRKIEAQSSSKLVVIFINCNCFDWIIKIGLLLTIRQVSCRHGILRERVSNARGRFISYCGRICGIL